ncbi:hypothetical protein KHA93_22340 [Bacillus sp. FJAT-49732]|uniref:Uncharacterized protein n=1 Tax=Lederbergia citrisecunda TaxID=2833583 RepID=A0A942TUC7_9BACI|nr:hypothetical protein [Lederbergia citrisecunda]MBS4202344.1 hypothetical protein [Lederbergia citrisecunda]
MYTVLTYFVTLFVIVISVFISLLIKYELEKMFREKRDVIPFHICNVLITLMVSFGAHTVMTIYIVGKEVNFLLQLVILLFMIFPIYFVGHLAFVKYKFKYWPYETTDNEKVIVLNEQYLIKKKLPLRLRNYNAAAKENKSKK